MRMYEALDRFGGVARKSWLRRLGVPAGAIEFEIDRGAVRVVLGMVTAHGVPFERIAEAAFSGQATCVTLLRQLDIPVPGPPLKVHLLLRRNHGCHESRTRPQHGVVLHRQRALPVAPHDRVLSALGVASQCVTPMAQLVMLNGALKDRLVLPEMILGMPSVTQARRVWLERHASPLSESVTETIAGVHLDNAGLNYERQVRIEGVGRVDFLVDGWLVVETDGWKYHKNFVAFVEDRRRDRALENLRYGHLRFTYQDVVHSPAEFIAQIRHRLRLGPERRIAG